MPEAPILSESEWRLMLELLERESYYLPVEIHHTDKRSYRAELRTRLDTITEMADRIRKHVSDMVIGEEVGAHV